MLNGSGERSISGRERLRVAAASLLVASTCQRLNSARSFRPFSPKGAPDPEPLAVALADALGVGKVGEDRVQAEAPFRWAWRPARVKWKKRPRGGGDARRSSGRTTGAATEVATRANLKGKADAFGSPFGLRSWQRQTTQFGAARRRARRRRIGLADRVVMERWLDVVKRAGVVFGGSGVVVIAPHRRLRGGGRLGQPKTGERRTDLQEAPPAWRLCRQNENATAWLGASGAVSGESGGWGFLGRGRARGFFGRGGWLGSWLRNHLLVEEPPQS